MSTILVTGGAGFIGSHLCEKLLEMGYSVVNLDSFNNYYNSTLKHKNIENVLEHKQYTLIKGDIRDKNMIKNIFDSFKINKIVHLAALAGVRNSILNPLEYADVDINGTINLLEHAAKYKVEKFIFASSSSVYGNSVDIPFNEQQVQDLPVSPYAAAKHSAELFCATYSHLYRIPMVALRFFTVYGPRQRPEMAISLFTRLIDKGLEVPVYGDGTSSRDYTYIDDILEGIISAIHLKCNYEVFNLGNSEPVRLNEVVEIIENVLGKRASRKQMCQQPGDVRITCADIKKSQNMLGYHPKVDIKVGIEKYVDWYLQNREIY